MADMIISFFRKKREDQEALLENARKLVAAGGQAFAWLTSVLTSFAGGFARRPDEAAARAEEGRGGANMN